MGDVDVNAINAATSLLQQANIPVEKLSTVPGASIAAFGNGLTNEIGSALSGQELRDFVQYVMLWRISPLSLGMGMTMSTNWSTNDFDIWQKLVKVLGDMKRTCESWSNGGTQDIVRGPFFAIDMSNKTDRQLGSRAVDTPKPQISTILDAKYASKEFQDRDPVFKPAVDTVQRSLNSMKQDFMLGEEQTKTLAQRLLTLKADLLEQRERLEKCTSQPFTLSFVLVPTLRAILARMNAATKGVEKLLASLGAGMASFANRQKYLVSGVDGAISKVSELRTDADMLIQRLPRDSDLWTGVLIAKL